VISGCVAVAERMKTDLGIEFRNLNFFGG